jgi:ribonuclease HI
MPWIKHRLRDADVWAKADASGALVTDRDGRVEIVYKPVDGAKTYRAGARNLTPVANAAPVELEPGEPAPQKPSDAPAAQPQATAAKAAPSSKSGAPPKPPEGSVQVWTDGACTGNPGPAGLGVVIIEDKERRELSEFLGDGTNNIAELMAILRGLQEVKDRTRDVYVYSDSEYSIGLLTKAWKAKKNVELIAELRELCRAFPKLHFVKVAGHAGIPLNERTDQLAREAIIRGR